MVDSYDDKNVAERGEVITKNKKDEDDISKLLAPDDTNSHETIEAKNIAEKLDAHADDDVDEELAPPVKVVPEPEHEEALLTATTPSTSPTPPSTPVSPPPHVPTSMVSGFGRPRRHRAKKMMLWILILIIGLAAGGGGVYAFYRKDINKPAKTVTVTKTVTVPQKTTTATPTARMLQFANANVQYPLDAKYDDYVLVSAPSPKTGVQSIGISSRGLMLAQATAYSSDSAKQTTCSPPNSPLGVLWVVDKNHLPADAADPLSVTSIQAAVKLGHAKDLGSSYLVYTTPPQVCSDNRTVSDQQTQLMQQQSLKDLIQAIVVIK
jgi:hypothetical protein